MYRPYRRTHPIGFSRGGSIPSEIKLREHGSLSIVHFKVLVNRVRLLASSRDAIAETHQTPCNPLSVFKDSLFLCTTGGFIEEMISIADVVLFSSSLDLREGYLASCSAAGSDLSSALPDVINFGSPSSIDTCI